MSIIFRAGVPMFSAGVPAMHSNCCCGTLPPSTLCGGCTSPPTQVQIQISGISSTACSALNGTYVLDFFLDAPPVCQYKYTFPTRVPIGGNEAPFFSTFYIESILAVVSGGTTTSNAYVNIRASLSSTGTVSSPFGAGQNTYPGACDAITGLSLTWDSLNEPGWPCTPEQFTTTWDSIP